jgi:hypothetical protein
MPHKPHKASNSEDDEPPPHPARHWHVQVEVAIGDGLCTPSPTGSLSDSEGTRRSSTAGARQARPGRGSVRNLKGRCQLRYCSQIALVAALRRRQLEGP